MPEEWFDMVTLHWSDETILDGIMAGGKTIKQTLTNDQLTAIYRLQSEHDNEMQRLLRSFVSE